MKILGIDPGSNITGFGIIEANKLKFKYITSGCIRTSGELTDKITIIFNGIRQIIIEQKPDIVVIERAFMRPDRPNPDAAIKLGHARGAIISAAGSGGSSITGSGGGGNSFFLTTGHPAKTKVVNISIIINNILIDGFILIL